MSSRDARKRTREVCSSSSCRLHCRVFERSLLGGGRRRWHRHHGFDGGELRTPRELSRRAILRQPLVVGHARRTVRAKSHPHIPARRTRDQKVVYKRWLLDRQQLFDTGDANDCGCALHAHGCYNGLVMALFARQKVEKLLLHCRIRFETKFAKLAPDNRQARRDEQGARASAHEPDRRLLRLQGARMSRHLTRMHSIVLKHQDISGGSGSGRF